MSRVDALPCALIDLILCFSGPVSMACDVPYVAATRLQRRWRRCRLTDDARVLFRWPWMRLWREGRVHRDAQGALVLRAERRVIFNLDRRVLHVIVVAGPRDGCR